MKRISLSIVLILLLSPFSLPAQGYWDIYLAQYDEGVGSTTLNMDRINTAPVKDLPFIVITGVTSTNCPRDGLPEKKELEKLQRTDDDLNATVALVTKAELVGTFTCQCERLAYFYVRDTLNIRDKLVRLYEGKYKSYVSYYIGIESDPAWETYLNFLYPNEEVLDYMSNEKVLAQLAEAGDKLDKARNVDHWLYFKSKNDRDAFIKYAEKEGFKVESAEYVKEAGGGRPYQLRMSKVGLVDIASISVLGIELKKKAREFGGDYDGWETVVVKE